MKKKTRVGLIIVAIVILIADLTFTNYSNLTWGNNVSS